MHQLFFLCLFARGISAAHIGLFASTGCYSHDMLMRNLADRLVLDGGHRVTVIQVKVYDFNRTFPAARSNWTYVSFNSSDADSASLQRRSQRLMWLTTLPFDADRFDMESVRVLDKIHAFHMRACFRALRDPDFVQQIEDLNLDLLVVDYVINDCALGIAYALMDKVKLAFLSNYPIVSSYVEDMGVSSNPSYVPAVIGAERLPMSLSRRAANAFLHVLVYATRQRFYKSVQRTFKLAIGIELPDLDKFDRRMLIFATPFEMLLDVPRPLVTGLRYFGCEHCTNSQTRANITQVLPVPESTKGYIIVSFGTVTKGDLIPIEQLIRMFRAFSKFPHHTIIWQLDAQRDYFEQPVLRALNATHLPKHIHIFSWIPLKNLLTDPRVVIMVSHGGVTTCIEAVNSGVPVLGVAIQGDQLYNLQRFVEKGVGEFLQVTKLNENVLAEKMSMMIRENARYKKAAVKLRSMLRDYKSLETESPSVFWLSWAVRHFSKNGTKRPLLAEKFVLGRHSSNWLVYYNLDIALVVGVVIAVVGHAIVACR